MKKSWIKYIPLVLGFMLFVACKNTTTKEDAGDNNRILTENPNLKVITDQIKNAPNDAGLYLQRGNALHRMQLDTLAMKDYKKAIKLDSTKAEYYSAIGELLFDNKDLTASVEWFQKAIAKNPADRRAHLKIAKLFLYIKEYDKAFAELNIVLRSNVYDPEAYFLKGMLYKDMKDTAKSISSFQTAVQVAPDYKEAIIQLGLMYSAKKDPLALSYLDKAFHADSTDVFPIFAKGVYHQQNKDFVAAKAAYKECIIRNNHYTDAYFNMGFIYIAQDSFAKAFRQFDMATKTDPTNPTAYYNRGVCSEFLDSIKNAVDDYKMAIALDTGYKSPKEALKRLRGNKN